MISSRLDELDLFIQGLDDRLNQSTKMALAFDRLVGNLGAGEDKIRAFWDLLVVRHKALLSSIEREISYWLSLPLTSAEKTKLKPGQSVFARLQVLQ